MSRELAAKVAQLPGVTAFDPLGDAILKILPPDAIQALHDLPPTHRDFLHFSNGMLAWYGYFRLFGFGYSPTGATDAFIWNMENMWKFAWPGKVAGFFCFGENVLGDQYAYKREAGKLAAAAGVFRLDAHTLGQTGHYASFEDFLTHEFLPNATAPGNPLLQRAHQLIGPLNAQVLLTYVPPRALGTPEIAENLRPVNARQVMIINGDLLSQITAAPPGSTIARVDTETDRMGMLRFKLVFAPPAK